MWGNSYFCFLLKLYRDSYGFSIIALESSNLLNRLLVLGYGYGDNNLDFILEFYISLIS